MNIPRACRLFVLPKRRSPPAGRDHTNLSILSEIARNRELQFRDWYRKFNRAVIRGQVDEYVEQMQKIWRYDSFGVFRKFEEDHEGNDVLKVACMHGRYELVQYLLHSGWKERINSPNHVPKNNETPFQLALLNGLKNQPPNLALLKLLANSGANLLIRDKTGRSCVDLLAQGAAPACVIDYVTSVYEDQKGQKEAVNLIFFLNFTRNGENHFINRLPKSYQRSIASYF